jgi:uncharacterized Zn finger protein
MPEETTRAAARCPLCATETAHEVLSPGGAATVRCGDCGHTHKTTLDTPDPVTVDVIVSQEGESTPTTTTLPPDEPVATGDEFVVDTPAALHQVRVTAVERPDGDRVGSALPDAVATVWTRVVGNVAVDVTVHPPAGEGATDESRSLGLRVPGDREFVVGETASAGDEEFEIEGIQVYADAGYRFDRLDHEGDAVFAKDVKRLYGRDTTTTAWSAW